MKKLIVKQDEQNKVPHEVMAQAIVDISNAMKKISESRLSEEAVITLIKDKTSFTKMTIRSVLSELHSLEKTWLKTERK